MFTYISWHQYELYPYLQYSVPAGHKSSARGGDGADACTGGGAARSGGACGVQSANPAHVQKNIPVRYPTEYCRYGYNSY